MRHAFAVVPATFALWALLLCLAASAEAPRVLAPGKIPDDVRLAKLKTLQDHFPFTVPDTAGAWHAREEKLRRRVLVANGLWPMPEKTPLEPVIYGKVEREGFTVERVYFQSLPGHYVTGLLFRPTAPATSPAPGVLSPHGHGGRMQSHSDAELARQIAQGAEHFEKSGRTPKLTRCAQLARMGCVTFIFDMLGYEDSIQIPFETAHRHKDARPEESPRSGEQGWVLFSPDAELRLQSIMGLQTWNAIRALDFLASLPDVDPERLAVTGGSGGGTQSILLGAIDDRLKVSFPNGMVSTSMQGGCYCENCNLLRVGTGNVELAALFAPRPQAMTAADDWTRDMMTDGYPELKWLYAMIGDEADVYCRPMLHFKHNYNYVTRATMYQWMNRHLQLGLDDPVIEQDFEPLQAAEVAVWNDQHPAPKQVGIPHERAVCRWLDQQASQQLDALAPRDAETMLAFRNTFGGAWEVIFDKGIPTDVQYHAVGEVAAEVAGDQTKISTGLVRDPARGAELPLLTVQGDQATGKTIVIWSSEAGKSTAFDPQGRPTERLSVLIEAGATVMLPDLLHQGEFLQDSSESDQQPLVDDERSYSAFTFGYNRTLVSNRCADLLSVIAHAIKQKPDSVRLLGTGGSASWVAPAAALAGSAVERAAIDTTGFRFADVESYGDANFVPGAVKYGDLPVLLALRAPHPLRIVGEAELPGIVAKSYSATSAANAVRLSKSNEIDGTDLDWLLQ
jgi:dienelactone hydrolase